jgi:serine/threonine-protein kinase PpkA
MLFRLLLICLSLMALAVQAQQRPLLMEGKKTLYQRVLSIPDARLYQTPDEQSASQPAVPFSVFYVYARDKGWLKLGYDSYGRIAGWMPEDQSIVWNQALTVAFKDPQDTQRVMLFRDRASLKKLIDDDDREAYARLYRAVVESEKIPDNPVVAIQPRAFVDIREDFYLVPIKQHEDVYLGSEQARLLQVASVPLLDKDAETRRAEQAAAGAGGYRSGIHFVIDATQSMGPYIDRTREAVRKVYAAIARQGLNNQVNFALTAFRDNTEQVPELDYLTRQFVSLQQGADAEEFFRRVDTLEPATISSRDYREDAYAGIKAAIENTDWSGFDARYVILITDAGPRDSNDSLGATGLSAEALRQLAYDKGISIWVLHLRSDSPLADHQRAEDRYRKLSYYPGIGDFYYGVELGKVDEFGKVLEVLSNQITQQVLATVNGVPPLPIPERKSAGTQDRQLADLQQKVEKLGNALRLRYLQKHAGEPVPKVFDAWMVDRDFSNPAKPSVEVRVLLTRDQLSDLKSVLQQVLELAEEGVLTPQNFLDDLKSLAASISRDPASVAGNVIGGEGNLADLGYMREYIEDLPYTGEVMNLSLARWEEWSAKEQIEFMNRLESKINYYQALHDHTDLWVTPGGGPVNGSSVFPVVLDLLP